MPILGVKHSPQARRLRERAKAALRTARALPPLTDPRILLRIAAIMTDLRRRVVQALCGSWRQGNGSAAREWCQLDGR